MERIFVLSQQPPDGISKELFPLDARVDPFPIKGQHTLSNGPHVKKRIFPGDYCIGVARPGDHLLASARGHKRLQGGTGEFANQSKRSIVDDVPPATNLNPRVIRGGAAAFHAQETIPCGACASRQLTAGPKEFGANKVKRDAGGVNLFKDFDIISCEALINVTQVVPDYRSEERRVGKECRYRWAREH